jgi:hypothetical protein
MKRIAFLAVPLIFSAACGSSDIREEESAEKVASPFVGVMSYGNCTPGEKTKLDAAVEVLIEITGTQFSPGAKYNESRHAYLRPPSWKTARGQAHRSRTFSEQTR